MCLACYGVKFLPDGPQNWQCSRCISDESHTAECALCSLRGGALKPTGNGRWAHIVCAIANTEVTFKSVSQREPVDISNISRPRATLVSHAVELKVKVNLSYCASVARERDLSPFEVAPSLF